MSNKQQDKKISLVFYKDQEDSFKYYLLKFNLEQEFNTVSGILKDIDSFSYCLAAARIIMQSFQGCLKPKDLTNTRQIDPKTKENLINKIVELNLKKRFYKWINFICECQITNNINKDHFVVFLKTNSNFQSNINQLEEFIPMCKEFKFDDFSKEPQIDLSSISEMCRNLFHKEFNINQELQELIESQSLPPTKENSYILLINQQKQEDIFQGNRPYIPAKGIYYGIFQIKHQTWKTYYTADSFLPTKDEIENTNSILISGSRHSVYDSDLWIAELKKWVQEASELNKSVQILGVCFGQQIVAEAFGGKVNPLEERKEKKCYYRLGIQKLTLSNEVDKLDIFKDLTLSNLLDPGGLQISQAHGDIVEKLPKDFKVLARSQRVPFEVIMSADERILCLQGHPEFASQWLKIKNSEFISFEKQVFGNIDEVNQIYQSESLKDQYSEKDDSQQLTSLCQSFLISTPSKESTPL